MTKFLALIAVLLLVKTWRQRTLRSTLYSKEQVDALLMGIREDQDRALDRLENPNPTRVVSRKTYSTTTAVFMSNTFQEEVLAALGGKSDRTLTLTTIGARRLHLNGVRCEEVSITVHGSPELISRQIKSAMSDTPFNVSVSGVSYDNKWIHTFEVTVEAPYAEDSKRVVVKEFEVIYLKPGEEPPVRRVDRVEEDLEDKIRAAVEVELDTRKNRVMQSAAKER